MLAYAWDLLNNKKNLEYHQISKHQLAKSISFILFYMIFVQPSSFSCLTGKRSSAVASASELHALAEKFGQG